MFVCLYAECVRLYGVHLCLYIHMHIDVTLCVPTDVFARMYTCLCEHVLGRGHGGRVHLCR